MKCPQCGEEPNEKTEMPNSLLCAQCYYRTLAVLKIDRLLDALQGAFNNGAFICPLNGHPKPELHDLHCQSCFVRDALTPGRYLHSEEEMRKRFRV